jgi:hypothetical protein
MVLKPAGNRGAIASFFELQIGHGAPGARHGQARGPSQGFVWMIFTHPTAVLAPSALYGLARQGQQELGTINGVVSIDKVLQG